jgi:hypothetical protein
MHPDVVHFAHVTVSSVLLRLEIFCCFIVQLDISKECTDDGPDLTRKKVMLRCCSY